MKPALGRNLGTLLGGPVSKSVPDLASAQSQLPLQQPGPGVSSLLRGQYAQPMAPSPVSSEVEPQLSKKIETTPADSLIPRWYFFAADVLLVAVALIFIYQCPPGARWALRLGSMALVLVGCGLGLYGVWIGADKEED